jgi:hypothetical protein
MTPGAPTRPDNVLSLLFGAGGNLPDALANTRLLGSIEDNLGAVLEELPGAFSEAAVREVATAAAQLLDVNLTDMLIAGWRDYKHLTSAARHTLAGTGSTELLNLATHQITGSLEPYISLLIDSYPIAKIQLNLSVACEIKAMIAKISVGRLVGVRTGYCDITATLTIENAEIVSRTTRLELPGLINFAQGIRLLPASDYLAADDRTQPIKTI